MKKYKAAFGKPVAACLLLLCISICACSENASAPVQQDPVRIGVIYPFSGHSAPTGEDLRAGVELAVEIINGSYDLPLPMAGREGLQGLNNAKIAVVFRDSGSDGTRAANIVESLVAEEGAKAILGCYNSTVTALASEQAEVMRVPFVNADSTSPVLTRRGLKWFFRTTPDDEMFAENFFAFFADLNEGLGIRVPRELALVYENRLWGTGVARAERKLAARHGYRIAADVPYNSRDDAYDNEIRQVRTASPGVILQSSYAMDAIRLIRGYRRSGIRPTAILGMNAGFISPSFVDELGPMAENILSREVWALDIAKKKPLVGTVNALFKERFGRNMTGNSARAFTGIIVLAYAIERAASVEPEAIRKALAGTDISGDACIMPWEGVRFDPDTGQNVLGKGIIVQIQNGEYRTVWPGTLTETPLVWPMPHPSAAEAVQ